eukprot:TRINITY_DN54137_c0_g1_i1.p1 TRINITY_DN54137_c0_g1~~TRINITY_DN54137_c0_g1_i1.p1  ORF type:complete len:178 (+),score=54.99 TRINITY_DN54137_c0_g1_i1:36-536(+)
MGVLLFSHAIDAIFKNWSALQLAVAHQSGGPQSKEKAEWLVGATESWFYQNKDLQDWEVGDLLEEIISNEFNLQIDDGSLVEVGRKICEYFEFCSSNNENAIRTKLLSLPRCDLAKCKVEDDEDDMDTDITEENEVIIDNLEIHEKKEPEVDEDGFQMVTTKKKKK